MKNKRKWLYNGGKTRGEFHLRSCLLRSGLQDHRKAYVAQIFDTPLQFSLQEALNGGGSLTFSQSSRPLVKFPATWFLILLTEKQLFDFKELQNGFVLFVCFSWGSKLSWLLRSSVCHIEGPCLVLWLYIFEFSFICTDNIILYSSPEPEK